MDQRYRLKMQLEKAANGVIEWDPKDIPVDKLSTMLVEAKALEARIKALYTYAENRLVAGEDIEGWKLVPKRGTRKWTDEAAVLAWAKRNGRLTKIFKKTLLSPTQASKVLKSEYDSVEKYTDSISSGVTMAPESDKRKAVSKDLGNALEAIASLPKL